MGRATASLPPRMVSFPVTITGVIDPDRGRYGLLGCPSGRKEYK